MKIWGLFIIALSLATPAYANPANSNHKDHAGTFNVMLENDIFANTDQHYTNGVRFSYLSAEDDVPDTIENYANQMPFFDNTGNKRFSFALGQSMFTPRDITTPNLIQRDRPYAGWLYATAGLISDHDDRLDNLQFTIGMVGPASLAKETQKFVHDHIAADDPKGWHHQLKNEPGFILTYERSWRNLYENTPFGWGVDITPHAGFSLGNIFTHAAAGATVRFGQDLPADYGPVRIRPSLPGSDFFIPTKDFSWYLFAGVEGRAVARNIFLDGNTFTNSHHVEKETFTGDAQMGLSMIIFDTRVSYTHIFRGKEYETQGVNDQFGALTVSWRF